MGVSEVVVVAASLFVGQAVANAVSSATASVQSFDEELLLGSNAILLMVFDRESDLDFIGAINTPSGALGRVLVFDTRVLHLVTRAVRSQGGSALSMERLDLIDQALSLVANGHTIVPGETFDEIRRREVPPPGLTNQETRWLVQLRDGATVATLAKQAGYSERSMHRHLHDLYTRIGVSGRSEALRFLDAE